LQSRVAQHVRPPYFGASRERKRPEESRVSPPVAYAPGSPVRTSYSLPFGFSICYPWALAPLRRCYTAEARRRHARVRATAVSGAGPVPRTVAVVTQERTTPLHPLRHVRPRGVDGALRPLGINGHALAGPVAVEVALIPVGAPLPDVAGHVVQA